MNTGNDSNATIRVTMQEGFVRSAARSGARPGLVGRQNRTELESLPLDCRFRHDVQ